MQRVVNLKLSLAIAIVAVVTLWSAGPSAASVVWSFDGVAFDDGGALSGTLTTDDSGAVLSWAFSTTTTGSFTGQTYDSATADNMFEQDPLTAIRFVNANGVWVDVAAATALTSGAGPVAISEGDEAFYVYPTTYYRTITAGSLVEQVAVPEPLAVAVLGSGLCGLAVLRRRH